MLPVPKVQPVLPVLQSQEELQGPWHWHSNPWQSCQAHLLCLLPAVHQRQSTRA